MIKKKLLERTKLFGELKSLEWNEILKITTEMNYRKDEIIFAEGYESTELYIVVKGEVELLIKIAPQLAESTVYTVKAYDVFGEFAFVDPKPRSATAKCKTDVALAVIERDRFDELIKKFPAIGIHFYKKIAQLLSNRLRRMNTYCRDIFIRSMGLDI